MSNLAIMRAFEVVSLILYLGALIWTVRSRNPYWFGLLIGASLVFVFDWQWSARGFFNATFNPDLTTIPGLTSYGMAEPGSVPPVIEPWSVALNYGFGFGPAIAMLLMATPTLIRTFGKAHYLVVFLCGVVGVALYEIPVVHIIGAWTYRRTNSYVPGALICAVLISWYVTSGTANHWQPGFEPQLPGAAAPART